jgi:hypothetical protein
LEPAGLCVTRCEMESDASRRAGERVSDMEMRRIFAGSLTALLLCVSSFAAACDFSCEFAQLRSDCHSPQMAAMQTGPADMAMDGMAMPGMDEPSSGSQQTVSTLAQAMPAHAAFVDMGACERQSCDQAQALAARTTHSTASQFDRVLTVAGFSHTDSLRAAFHEARDDIASLSPIAFSPLKISLRI